MTSATGCAVVGGGPAGTMLAYLLARQGIDVTLIEAKKDFDRKFRGDAIMPWAMELMDALGLAERVLELQHSRVPDYTFETERGPVRVTDYSMLRTRYNYMSVVPQARLLELVVSQACQYPGFRLLRQTRVNALIEDDDGVVRGVRCTGPDGGVEIHAQLVVGADGRFPRVRELAGLPAKPLFRGRFDALWFTLPKALAVVRAPRDVQLTGRP